MRYLSLSAAVIATTFVLTACSDDPNAPAASGSVSDRCSQTVAPEDVKIVLGVGALSSSYWQEFIKGATAVADSLGIEVTTYESNFDGQTILNTLSSSLAGGGVGTAIVVDPASNAFTKPIVQAAEQSGAHIVTLWNRPVDVHPWDFGGGCWVAHTSFDGVDSGKENSAALADAIGDSGDIVAVQGVPDDPPNKQRLFGMQETLADNVDVTLLDTQTGNWSAATAQTVVNALLAKYPDQIKGIFSTNDDMAVGSVEALRAKGLNGKVFVTGSDGSPDMLNLIKSGDALSTMQIDAYGQGAYATAIAYASVVGDISANDLSHAQRDFFLDQRLITAANVDEALAVSTDFDPSKYAYDAIKGDLWAESAGQIDDATWIPDVK